MAISLEILDLPGSHVHTRHHREGEKDICAVESGSDFEKIRNPVVKTGDSAEDEHRQSDREPSDVDGRGLYRRGELFEGGQMLDLRKETFHPRILSGQECTRQGQPEVGQCDLPKHLTKIDGATCLASCLASRPAHAFLQGKQQGKIHFTIVRHRATRCIAFSSACTRLRKSAEYGFAIHAGLLPAGSLAHRQPELSVRNFSTNNRRDAS